MTVEFADDSKYLWENTTFASGAESSIQESQSNKKANEKG